MRLGSGSSPDPTAALLTVLVAGLVLYSGLQVFDAAGASKSKITESRETAMAYCYQAFGDASVYTAAVEGGHGGFHCVGNQASPHYHEVTDDAKEAAMKANQTGERVNWSRVNRYETGAGGVLEWFI